MRVTKLWIPLCFALCFGCGDDAGTAAGGSGGSGGMAGSGGTGGAMTNTIVDVAAGAADFSTLVTAVQAAGLVEALSGEGPFTVFAPTNAAFEALPPGLLDTLLMEENRDTLIAILQYHVVPGEQLSQDVLDATSFTTLQGEDITVGDGSATLNETINVTSVDIPADNGVIHEIDGVLVPPTIAATL